MTMELNLNIVWLTVSQRCEHLVNGFFTFLKEQFYEMNTKTHIKAIAVAQRCITKTKNMHLPNCWTSSNTKKQRSVLPRNPMRSITPPKIVRWLVEHPSIGGSDGNVMTPSKDHLEADLLRLGSAYTKRNMNKQNTSLCDPGIKRFEPHSMHCAVNLGQVCLEVLSSQKAHVAFSSVTSCNLQDKHRRFPVIGWWKHGCLYIYSLLVVLNPARQRVGPDPNKKPQTGIALAKAVLIASCVKGNLVFPAAILTYPHKQWSGGNRLWPVVLNWFLSQSSSDGQPALFQICFRIYSLPCWSGGWYDIYFSFRQFLESCVRGLWTLESKSLRRIWNEPATMILYWNHCNLTYQWMK